MAAVKAMEKAISREGRNTYTQSEKRYKAGEGYSDCSSLMWWAYKEAYNIDIGTWTGEQVRKGVQVAFYGGKATLTKEDCDKLEVGDLIFFGSGDAKHVEMYVGNYRLFGHGSNTPSYKNALTYRHGAGVCQARRYYNISNETGDDIKPLKEIKLPEVYSKSKGKFVEFLQGCLNVYNYGLKVTGTFDSETRAAVKTFQRVHCLYVDGIVGVKTWTELLKNITI